MAFGTGWGVRSDVFLVVPRNIPVKPIVYLDALHDVSGVIEQPPCTMLRST